MRVIGILFLVAVIGVSCSYGTPVAPDVTPNTDAIIEGSPTISRILVSENRAIRAIPTTIVTKDDLSQFDSDLVYPATITFNGYLVGYNADMWGNSDYQPVLGHNSADTLGIKIYNSHDEPAIFSIKYQDAYKPTSDAVSNVIFQKAPPQAKEWVTIEHSILTIKAHELVTIPISFHVPTGVIGLPDNWEFRLLVTNLTYASQVMANGSVRCLVIMGK